MSAKTVVEKFGGQTALAALIGIKQSGVSYWVKQGTVPAKWHDILLEKASNLGIVLSREEFFRDEAMVLKTPVNNELYAVSLPSTMGIKDPKQQELALEVSKQIEVDGIGMGVLSDGTAFLTGQGLARLCGVDYTAVFEISNEWNDENPKPRVSKIKDVLASHGIDVPKEPYVAINQRSGFFYAYSDAICLAILEYYSFDAGNNIKDQAKKNYRLLAGKGLRDLIYTQVGYDPKNSIPDVWKQFHDRVSLTYNSVPHGYFGIFKEMADMIVTLGQSGLAIDEKFVPDISVGLAWAKHWKSNNLEHRFGERIKYEHNYPDYFKQSLSNPQDANCYPESSLGEFRRWLREEYINGGKLKSYLETKVKDKTLPVSFAQLAIAAYGISPSSPIS